MHIRILGAPMDLGADRRGIDMGASAILYAGLSEALQRLGHTVSAIGNIAILCQRDDQKVSHISNILNQSFPHQKNWRRWSAEH